MRYMEANGLVKEIFSSAAKGVNLYIRYMVAKRSKWVYKKMEICRSEGKSMNL